MSLPLKGRAKFISSLRDELPNQLAMTFCATPRGANSESLVKFFPDL
jgi:hypothetical protein